MMAAFAVLENKPFIWVLRCIIKFTTLRQSYFFWKACISVLHSLLKLSSLMLPFGTKCLPVSLCNLPSAVKTEFKPESAVMLGPSQLILCVDLLGVRRLCSKSTVQVLWPLWVPLEGTEATGPPCPPSTALHLAPRDLQCIFHIMSLWEMQHLKLCKIPLKFQMHQLNFYEYFCA